MATITKPLNMSPRAVAMRERKAAHEETKRELDAICAKNRTIVAAGCCPQCSSKIKRNSSIAGWWQCEQYGSESFRARPSEPHCSWQCFTE